MSNQETIVLFGLASLLGASIGLAEAEEAKPLTYPQTRRVDQFDDYHGTRVADPYRWLEDDVRKSKDVEEWVAEENKLTNDYLKAIPQRDKIKKHLTQLWNYEKFTAPFKVGGRYFYSRNDGLQNQNVLYVQDSLEGQPKVLEDPNKWTKDGTAALGITSVSDDGKFLAYIRNDAGSDWGVIYIKDINSGEMLHDKVQWVKFSEIAWTKDNRGFFYSRFEEPKEGAEFQSLNLNQKLCYHRVGTPQSDDVLVYQRTDQPKWAFSASVSEDGRYLIISTWKGTDHNSRVTYKDLSEPYGLPVDLVDHFENEYSFIDNDGPIFYFKTDLQAPRGRIIAIDIRKPGKENWKELVPQDADSLTSVNMVNNLFVCSYLKDAYTQVKLFSPQGKLVREVKFPGIGTATGFAGHRADTDTFYSFSSFATPPSIYHYDLLTGESKLFRKSNVKFDADKYEVKQVFYKSKDGTKVPMFITHRKGITLDGSHPTLLYGYGGFNIPLTPEFKIGHVLWLEMGGIYAQANLRGGGEYGQDWHKAGTKLHKQNVFDDFIAAAEYLIETKYTQTSKLAIEGRSNGGLLVGACLTQRPDLYGACLPGVGVMDMLRFQRFTAGRYWVDDYGSSDNSEEFKALYAYSPYHNLKKGTKYPATLVTTADTDDRVVPGHSFKFIAQLQYCQAGSAPVLARIETKAGHGAGKPTSKLIEEVADQVAFLVKNLNMTLPE